MAFLKQFAAPAPAGPPSAKGGGGRGGGKRAPWSKPQGGVQDLDAAEWPKPQPSGGAKGARRPAAAVPLEPEPAGGANLLAAANELLVAAGQPGLTKSQLGAVAAPPPPEGGGDLASKSLSQILQRRADKAKQVEKSKGRVEERAAELAAAQAQYDAE
eukprot:8324410-Pyramimonas_sp.AAC.1